MRTEEPACVETKATDAKGSLGRHYGLVRANSEARYRKARDKAEQKLAQQGWGGFNAQPPQAAAPPKPVAPTGQQGWGGFHVEKPKPPAVPTPTSSVATPAQQSPAAWNAQNRQRYDATMADRRAASVANTTRGLGIGSGNGFQAPAPDWANKVPPKLYTGTGSTSGGLVDVATSLVPGAGKASKILNLAGVPLAAGTGIVTQANTAVPDDAAQAARKADAYGMAGSAALDAGNLISSARAIRAVPWLNVATEALEDGTLGERARRVGEGAAATGTALGAASLVGAGALPATLAVTGANSLKEGLRNTFTDKGQQKVQDEWRTQVLADQGGSDLGNVARGAGRMLTGAGVNNAQGAAALGRAIGKVTGNENVANAEKGFLADESARQHYEKRIPEFTQAYVDAGVPPELAQTLGQAAAAQDSNTFWQSQMLGKPVRAASYQGKNVLDSLRRQIGPTAFNSLMESADYGPALQQWATAGGQLTAPNIDRSAYVR